MTTPSQEGPLAVSTSEASGEAGIGTQRRRKARTLFDRLDEQAGGYARTDVPLDATGASTGVSIAASW